ncbi:hypothetical protein [Neolewinella sp.]|uniref:hypothetical protein n=1 Tax=Neolewinella sp. TaxID=2993543 RepID=UPI003B51CF83
MPRTKLTGFSRLLIFLLIALPIVYAGAAYYNGEDPVANVKGWLGMDETDTRVDYESVQEGLREENDRLRQELARCQAGTTGS